MKRLAILGASGHGKVVADCAEMCGWSEIVFFDDRLVSESRNGHWSVSGNTQDLIQQLSIFDGVLVAIGNNRIREEKLKSLSLSGAPLVTLVHPSAQISRYAYLAPGTVVFANAAVNVDARIGMGGIVNTGATIDHDCVLGTAVHVSPGAHLAGGVRVGDRSWVGIGASVRQLVQIGNDVMVGAGAAVVQDIADGLVVVGVPAKPLQPK